MNFSDLAYNKETKRKKKKKCLFVDWDTLLKKLTYTDSGQSQIYNEKQVHLLNAPRMTNKFSKIQILAPKAFQRQMSLSCNDERSLF